MNRRKFPKNANPLIGRGTICPQVAEGSAKVGPGGPGHNLWGSVQKSVLPETVVSIYRTLSKIVFCLAHDHSPGKEPFCLCFHICLSSQRRWIDLIRQMAFPMLKEDQCVCCVFACVFKR